MITIFIITIDEECVCKGDDNCGIPKDDGAEDDNINDDGDYGRVRTTMTMSTTRITTTMMRMMMTIMLQPTLVTTVIEAMIERRPR